MPRDELEPTIRQIPSWQTPATGYPRRTHGRATIGWAKYPAGFYEAYQTGPGSERYTYWHAPRTLKITNLSIDGKEWMIDDPPHWWAMQEHAAAYSGNILVAGLGLGLILHALESNPAVTNVTVVEKEPDVIELIRPLVPDHFIIVEHDWWQYHHTGPVDGVFYDLFVGEASQLLPAAISTYIDIAKTYPSAKEIRIHGFRHTALKQLVEQAKGRPVP